MSNGGAARKRVKILSKFACENRDLPDQNMPFLRSKSPPEPRQRTAPQPLALACRWLGAAELLWLAQAVRVGRPASGPCMLSSTTDTQARLSGKRMHVSCLIHDLLLGHCGLSACRISLMTPCSSSLLVATHSHQALSASSSTHTERPRCPITGSITSRLQQRCAL